MSSEVVVRIPTPLRSYVGGADQVMVAAETVGEALLLLAERYDGIGERILTADATPRPFVNVFVGSADIRTRQGLATPLGSGDVIAIVPAVAGGGDEGEG
jgi:molybdopterin converting factor small subunit